MSEEKNIQEQPEDDRPPATDDNETSVEGNLISSEENKTVAEENIQHSTPNIQHNKENMEVHHHGHVHEKKKWKEYLFQFFMLFLAVFCGFLAENHREHYIEDLREEEIAKALYTELLEDSVALAGKIKLRLKKEADLDYLHRYFNDSSLTSLSHEFYPVFTKGLYLLNIFQFEPKDGMLSQLRNSGSLRYFHNMSIQKLLGDVSVAINEIRAKNQQEFQFFSDEVKSFLRKHYDFTWLDKLRTTFDDKRLIDVFDDYDKKKLKIDIEGKFLNPSSFKKEDAANMLMYYKQVLVSTRILQLKNYININRSLLVELRQNYRLFK